ncbi:hypothetical protein G3480_09595 [Thiorhodococcus mannitoliphagus]|uniref:EF-hand domain-containing protein n=1 Tax=Thiorhodococcus mannitoliphagus TaxID=329406 RepID=A0A6P1DUB7_9GAMM|nr:EF-hand domain-containing protein [Thiorhodococcus mannitoliphagus]NEX20561.1 hypothetical protein [Thiorhodococcus mannitoliphagus]
MSSILTNIGDIASSLYGAKSEQTQRYGSPTDSIEQVFSYLDTEGKGYLDTADFAAAFESLGLRSGDGSLADAGAEEVVSVLDLDGDGRVTTDDMTQGLQTLTDSLGVLRGRESPVGPEAVGAMTPPPTPEQVLGFTEEALKSQFEALTSGAEADPEDEGTQLLASILDDFETADADGDGRVSGEEAMAFARSLESAPAAISEAASESTTEAEESAATAAVLKSFEAADADGDGLLSSDEAVAYVQSSSGITDDATEDSVIGAATQAVAGTTGEGSTEQLVMRRIMALMDAYGSSSSAATASDLLSELA